jgi:hypothetical protein
VSGDVADLFTTAPVTRSRAPADVEVELEVQLQRLFADPSIPKIKRQIVQGTYERIQTPTEEDTRRFLAWIQDIRRRHGQLAAALQHAG